LCPQFGSHGLVRRWTGGGAKRTHNLSDASTAWSGAKKAPVCLRECAAGDPHTGAAGGVAADVLCVAGGLAPPPSPGGRRDRWADKEDWEGSSRILGGRRSNGEMVKWSNGPVSTQKDGGRAEPSASGTLALGAAFKSMRRGIGVRRPKKKRHGFEPQLRSSLSRRGKH